MIGKRYKVGETIRGGTWRCESGGPGVWCVHLTSSDLLIRPDMPRAFFRLVTTPPPVEEPPVEIEDGECWMCETILHQKNTPLFHFGGRWYRFEEEPGRVYSEAFDLAKPLYKLEKAE